MKIEDEDEFIWYKGTDNNREEVYQLHVVQAHKEKNKNIKIKHEKKKVMAKAEYVTKTYQV